MIETEQQYRLTKAQADGFARTLLSLRQRVGPIDGIHPRIAKAQEDAVRSQLADLESELREYESQKPDKFRIGAPEGKEPMTVWKVRGGRYGEREQEVLQEGMLTVRSTPYDNYRGASIPLGDLSALRSYGDARTMVQQAHPAEQSAARIRNWARYAWYFAHEMPTHDLVVMPHQGGHHFSVGEVSGRYVHRPAEPEWSHGRQVLWLGTNIPDSNVAPDLRASIHAPGTIHRIRCVNAEEQLRTLLKIHRSSAS